LKNIAGDFKVNAEKTQRWISSVIALCAFFMVGAVVWDIFSPGAKTARIVGFAAFGVLCIFLRALPQKFLTPKPKK
jgi:hypothetical protein